MAKKKEAKRNERFNASWQKRFKFQSNNQHISKSEKKKRKTQHASRNDRLTTFVPGRTVEIQISLLVSNTFIYFLLFK